MVIQAFVRQWKKMIMIAFTIALGASLATAMLNVMFDVGDKVNQELKTYGANIRVVPQTASILNGMYGVEGNSGLFLKENELGKIKTIFWAFNIVDFAPFLDGSADIANSKNQHFKDVKITGTWFNNHMELPTGESLDTGIKAMKSWWTVNGEWLNDTDSKGIMLGSSIAEKIGAHLEDELLITANNISEKYIVKGIFDAGSEDDDCIFMNLKAAQHLMQKAGLVSRIDVSALTTPDNELSRRAAQDPQSLNIVDWDTWYCTAYVSSICYQLQEVISNSSAKAVRQVAESEGAILNKTKLLMLLITILSLIGSALGISNLVTASVMERAQEIGLLKAVGAHNGAVTALVLTEILITAIIGCTAGYFAGIGFAQIIGQSVFASSIAIKVTVIPIVIILIMFVTLIGSIPSIRMLLHLEPAEVLHGR